MQARVSKYGLFHPAYLLFNFIYMFLQGPHFQFTPPALLTVGYGEIDQFGTSITFASPFVFFAVKAKWQKGVLCAAWISIVVALIHAMCYYTNGWGQMNTQRFTMDFMPILILLVALGIQHVTPLLWKAAIAYAIILNVIFHFGLPILRIIQNSIT
jgi:hypothetical protein